MRHEILGWKGSIFLLLDDTNNFCLISRLNAFFGKEGHYCQSCYNFFSGNSSSHVCDASLCKQWKTVFSGRSSKTNIIRCTQCKRGFYGQLCFQRHLEPGRSPLVRGKHNSVCKSFVACPLCNRDLKAENGISEGINAYDRGEQGKVHVCFKNKCRDCGRIVETGNHQCFIKSINVDSPEFIDQEKRNRGKHWFFDMATMKVYDAEKSLFLCTQFNSVEE